tara:strand:- start:118 stop:264 length:147 start_codon:yes stop_codon:yes gene_type:complete
MDFLTWYLEEMFKDNLFTEGYGEKRAFSDGKAKAAEEVYQTLKGLTND